jgi:antitoxin MazE
MLISKWGNSLAVRLPKELVKQMGLNPGDEIAIVKATKEQIDIEKIDRRKAALERLSQMNWKLPEGYKFDRDEANER